MNYSLLRRLSAGAVCAALLATMTACGGGSAAPAADSADSSADGGTVKVGLLHSLTGSMAISETSVRDAEVPSTRSTRPAASMAARLSTSRRTAHPSLPPLPPRRKS